MERSQYGVTPFLAGSIIEFGGYFILRWLVDGVSRADQHRLVASLCKNTVSGPENEQEFKDSLKRLEMRRGLDLSTAMALAAIPFCFKSFSGAEPYRVVKWIIVCFLVVTAIVAVLVFRDNEWIKTIPPDRAHARAKRRVERSFRRYRNLEITLAVLGYIAAAMPVVDAGIDQELEAHRSDQGASLAGGSQNGPAWGSGRISVPGRKSGLRE